MTRQISMIRAGAVEREKTSHARGPGPDSRPGIFSPFLGPFSFASFFFSTFFVYLLTGFSQFIHSDAPLQLHEMLR